METKIQIIALFATLTTSEQLSMLEELAHFFETSETSNASTADLSVSQQEKFDLFDKPQVSATTVKATDKESRNARILSVPVAMPKPKHCIECGSEEIIGWGKYNNVNRYKCKHCHRTFTPNTGNLLHGIHKVDEFLNYGERMFDGQYHSISWMCEEIGIDQNTAFDWRHKYLSAISSTPEELKFTGTVEMDDVWVVFNEKGRKDKKDSHKRGGTSGAGDNDSQVKVLFTVERQGAVNLTVVRSGRLWGDDITRAIGDDSFAPGAVLVSDKHASIGSFAKKNGVEHKIFKADEHVADKDVHVQTVNNMAASFKAKINGKMHGVATKYLQNYANWFRIEERYKGVVGKIIDIIDNHMRNNKTWDYFSNIEQIYKRFLEKYSRLNYEHPVGKFRKTCNWNFQRIEELLL